MNSASFSWAIASFCWAACFSLSRRWISWAASALAPDSIRSFSACASCTSLAAIFWAVSSVCRMASSVERYSSTFSASTFSLAFSVTFSLNRVL